MSAVFWAIVGAGYVVTALVCIVDALRHQDAYAQEVDADD